MEMGEAYKLVNTLAPSSLPIYRADVEKMMEGARAKHRQQESAVQQGCYRYAAFLLTRLHILYSRYLR